MGNRTVTVQEWGKIFATAWTDTSYAELLRTDPTAAVRKLLEVDEDTPLNIFMVPPRPADLTDEQLEGARDGTEDIQMPYCC